VTAVARLVLLVTSPRVAAGLLSADAWAALTAGPVFSRDADSPALAPMSAAGVAVQSVEPSLLIADTADLVVAAARREGVATWWVGPDGDQDIARALAERCEGGLEKVRIDLEVLHGSWDVPGSRLLDVVATMDRLRSPGGCPWDADQNHRSLAPYLLEEAYEAFQAIEDEDSDGLREELGDVLLQIAFHARLAEELPEDERWSIDDVAGGLVEKLIRRHPHVFDGLEVDGAEEVNANWESIKAAERGDASPLANVPLAAPALTLAATLQRKAARDDLASVDAAGLPEAVDAFADAPSVASAGELLWLLVAAMRAADLDPEAVLRARSREFRDSAGHPPGVQGGELK
jgi:XTP/dITP diphosphohydrolase